MGFVRMKGVTGLVYVPDDDAGPKKHPCPDCHFCQWCSDNRCELCLQGRSCTKSKGPEDRDGAARPGTCRKRRG
ncbi:MAG TPA: hypothetical protein PKM41_04730 [Deltaproteobacteria bacterium]|nr:hypothetical protein [Deltaproteobacteria bacterium]HOI05535.1 hypothetical protein [Deltaproteobacteria bacterium]